MCVSLEYARQEPGDEGVARAHGVNHVHRKARMRDDPVLRHTSTAPLSPVVITVSRVLPSEKYRSVLLG